MYSLVALTRCFVEGLLGQSRQALERTGRDGNRVDVAGQSRACGLLTHCGRPAG